MCDFGVIRTYTREERLIGEVSELLSRIAVGPEIVEALVEEARVREAAASVAAVRARTELEVALNRNGQRAGALLDSLLDGIITREVYAAKDEELARERRALELRLSEHETQASALSSQVEALASIGASAHMKFENADHELRRRVLASVLW